MANQNDPGYQPGTDWFVDSPGGDQPLDNLFPDPNGDGQQATPPSSENPPQPQQDWFLKTPTGTVYKTPEDAVNGITHKDTLIEELRAYAVKQTGYDPVSKKQVHREPQGSQPPANPSESVSYRTTPKRFWDDLVGAAQRGDADAYAKIQEQFVQEQLAPYAPLIAQVARTGAVETVSQAYPKFREFYTSQDYRKTLDSIPRLNEAIQYAERNAQAADQLADLYKMAYLASQGLRLAEVPAENPPMVQQPPQPQTRQTVTSGQLPPPNQQAPQNFDLSTREGRSEQRQAIMRAQEAKGVLDLPM